MDIQEKKTPKIVSFDLEVSPAVGYFYPPTWDTRILKLKERQKLMSFAYQVVGQKKITSLCLADMPGYKKNPFDDKKLVEELHKVMSDADILLGQNSDRFDIKMANYFFIRNDLKPIPPARTIDTLKIAKKYFRFPNNSLDMLGEELGVGNKTKVKHSDIWYDCFIEQDKKMWKKMNKYCEQDVRMTTEVYLKMRAFAHNHPSLSRISGEWDSCPTCGSYAYRVKAYRYTNVSRYRQFECQECFSYFNERKAITEKEGDIKPRFK